MKKKKKLIINIDADLKSNFIKITKLNETDASKEIRKFIKEYVAKNAQLDLKI